MVENLFNFIIYNEPINMEIGRRALARSLASNGPFLDSTTDKIDYDRIALFKLLAFAMNSNTLENGLNLNNSEEKQQTDIGHVLGRKLALADKVQNQVQYNYNSDKTKPWKGATVGDKLYSTAVMFPTHAFTEINKSLRINLASLRRQEDMSSLGYFENILAEINSLLPPANFWPKRLSFKEQINFDLGYADQRQHMRKSKTTTTVEETIEELEIK